MTSMREIQETRKAFDEADACNDVAAMMELSGKLTVLWEAVFTEAEILELLEEFE